MSRDFGTTIQDIDMASAGTEALPRVLLVDDDALVRTRLQALISAAGFQVTVAGDARSALAALEQDFTPVLITDRDMPGMDGLELCARIGGEEFVVVLGHTSEAGAALVAETVRAAVAAAPIPSGTLSIPVTVSIGVAVLPEQVQPGAGPSVEALLNEADRRLYQSKEAGRNRVTLPCPVPLLAPASA